MWSTLDRFRELKNTVFEASLHPRAKKLFWTGGKKSNEFWNFRNGACFQHLRKRRRGVFKPVVGNEKKVSLHATQPITSGGWKELLVSEAFEIYIERSEPGWDGYDASPLSKESFLHARSFIDMIPVWAPRPDLVPSPDGGFLLNGVHS